MLQPSDDEIQNSGRLNDKSFEMVAKNPSRKANAVIKGNNEETSFDNLRMPLDTSNQ